MHQNEARAIEVSGEAARAIEVSAAWEVWCDRFNEVRRRANTNSYGGDMSDAGQLRDMREQFDCQIAEAYARGRVQCAIALAVDRIDTSEEYDQHWQQTWGSPWADRAAVLWREQYAAALARQLEARAKAAAAATELRAIGQ